VIALPGKLPIELLQRAFLSGAGTGQRIVIPPMVGGDAGAVDIEGFEIIAAHSDPITASMSRIGWLSIHVAANDIAAIGIRPFWFLTTLILPEGIGEDAVFEIASDVKKAIAEVGGTLLGGHTEFSNAVNRPVISTTAMGAGRREELTPASNAKPGDAIIMTKTAALEASFIAASDYRNTLKKRGVDQAYIDEAKTYLERISVLPEALVLSKHRMAHAMHDPTEGGIAAASFEISYASGWAVEIDRKAVLISKASKKILEALGVDPLFSLSSGSLLACVPPDRVEAALSLLSSEGIDAAIIGKVLEERGKKLYIKNGKERELIVAELPQDHFIRTVSEIGEAQR